MPRQPRLDLPGFYYHVIARGVNRRTIFLDDRDRTNFLGRLAKMLEWSGSRCFAWSLMPNHFHLLIQSGVASLGRTLHRILTGYAVTFNQRYNRVGHLFQNRFKSILCDTDSYFRELVRYIHLNPLRAKLITTLAELDTSAFTGHSVLMGHHRAPWQEISETLAWWGNAPALAKERYRQYLAEGLKEPEPEHLEQGKGLRSVIDPREKPSANDSWDIPLLGDGDFAARVMAQVETREALLRSQRHAGATLETLVNSLCGTLEIPLADALSRSKKPAISRFRALAAYRAVDEMGYRAVDVARLLKVSEAALSGARERGRALCAGVEVPAMGGVS